MIAPPIPMVWTGDSLEPKRGFSKLADQHFTIGEVYQIVAVEERSERTHNHEFAQLKDYWLNLPEAISDQFPTVTHFRKALLIDCGFYDETRIDAGSNAAALRVAAYARAKDEYSRVVVRGNLCVIRDAKSQARGAMDKAEFQASKTAILEAAADLIGVPVSALSEPAKETA